MPDGSGQSLTPTGRDKDDWFMMGLDKKLARDWNGAITYFNKAIELNPDYHAAYRFRGETKWGIHDYRGAEKDFSEAIRLQPDDPVGYNNRGFTRSELGKYMPALADFEMVLLLDPKNEYARTEQAINGVLARQYQGSRRELTTLIERRPDDVRLRYMRALARIGLDDYYGAMNDCDVAISLDPKGTAAFQFRGLAKYHLGLHRAALKDYNRFVELSENDTFSLLVRSMILEMIGDFPAALADLDAAAARAKAVDSDVLLHRAIVRQRLGQPSDDLLAQAIATWSDERQIMLGQFLVNQVSEEDLLSFAAQGDRELNPNCLCAAYYFTGMVNLMQGKEAHGVELLLLAVSTRQTNSYEYMLALAELARLNK